MAIRAGEREIRARSASRRVSHGIALHLIIVLVLVIVIVSSGRSIAHRGGIDYDYEHDYDPRAPRR